MQLILKSETTADLKTKMSLNDDTFEKCVTDAISIVTNGDLSNGDISNENNESGDSIKGEKNKLVLETHKVELMTADGKLEQLDNEVENSHADIEKPVNQDLDQADKINVVNNEGTVEDEISDALSNNDKNNEISTKNLNNEAEEETSSILSHTELNICNRDDKMNIDACESVTVEEKCPENLKSENSGEIIIEEKPAENAKRKCTKNNDSHNFNQSFTDNNVKVHTELAIVDIETEISDKTEKSGGVIQSFAVDEQTETTIDKNATELCNDNGTEDVSSALSDGLIDTEPVDKKQQAELNYPDDPMEDDIIITMDRNGTIDDIIKNNFINIDGTAHNESEDETIEKEHTVDSGEKLVNDEMMTDDDCIVNFPEDEITKTNTCEETDEKQDANQIENTENDTPQIRECRDETIENEHTAASNEEIYNEEQMMTDSDDIIDYPEDEMKTKTCEETDEKQHSNQMKNTENDTPLISECGDGTIEKQPPAARNEKINNDEQMMIDSDGTRDCPEDELKTKTCKETDEKQEPNLIKNKGSESEHSDHTDKMDVAEGSISIDFKNVTDDNESGNESQSLHKNTKIPDPVENKPHSDVDCVTENQECPMNVDDEDANISEKAETEINLSTSPVNSPSNLNDSVDRTVTVGCSINAPVATQKNDTVALVPDDFIFNVDDDDKEKSPKPSDINAVESTEIIADKDNCDIDNDKVAENVIVPETKTPESSLDIIDLDETVSKCVTSDLNTPDQDNEKLHENTIEKISEVLNPPANSDDIIDLNKSATKLTSSESKICNVNSNERQDDATEKISRVVSPILKLSNTLDILSDDEEGLKETNENNKCINIEDDDDIMLIDDDTSGNESKTDEVKEKESESEKQVEIQPQTPVKNIEINKEVEEDKLKYGPEIEADITEKENVTSIQTAEITDKAEPNTDCEIKKPLLQEKFLKNCKKNLADMTREELEEFCVLKIVESILDRSNLSEIRTKLKTMAQNIDEYKKKAMVLEKQTRDLQLVLKSVQDEQEKGTESIVPLKITRSVGMQVMMGLGDKQATRKKITGPPPANKPRNAAPPGPRPQKPATPQKQSTPQIPVPRLVPANNPTLKSPTAQQTNPGKVASPVPNGIKTPSPAQKGEKRTHNRIQSVTVDLTDDEPPAKIMNRAVPVVPPVRLVPSQNLLAPPRQQVVTNSPRKVYIPISGPQGQNVRPGQTIMLKTVPSQGTRQRCPPPQMVRMPQTLRMPRPQGMRHPAPLPDCVKQYQPPNWKALPPAPDLKLAKVENGIVISWKIEGYQEDSYEEIASYQLYAYQETSSPPNTALWKKIGDVKALPLPMACTLTQFMAGYKYYFAVRALDIRSRLGPFSLPGSILLLNKM